MRLDLSPFDSAIRQLQASLQHAALPIAQNDPAVFGSFRAGSIQAFEFTYALALKFLGRMVEILSANPETVGECSFRDILRMGQEFGLIRAPQMWFDFREKRNITSHTYDEAKAVDVYAIIPSFRAQVLDLRDKIEQRLERE